jgi:hypothetical protein
VNIKNASDKQVTVVVFGKEQLVEGNGEVQIKS